MVIKRRGIKKGGYLVEYQDASGETCLASLMFEDQNFAFKHKVQCKVGCLNADFTPVLDNEEKQVFISRKLSELTIKGYID